MALRDVGGSPDFFDRAARFGSERNPDYRLGVRNAQTVITHIQNLHPMPDNPDVAAATELATTNRARCFSGNHSSTDGGNKKPVSRSIERKLAIDRKPSSRENQLNNSNAFRRVEPVKSDGLLLCSLSTA